MGTTRTTAEQQVADLLATARGALGLSVTFLTRMDGTTQTIEVVDSSVPLLQEGSAQPQERTLCQAVLDGALPAVVADVREHPEAVRRTAARFPRLRSFVSVPVVLSDGSLYGTFCGAGLTTDGGLADRDRALMEVLARAAAVVLEPGVRERARVAEVQGRLLPLLDVGGPHVVLQPIVDLSSGRRIGAEALSRFPAAWGMTPDVCFAEAHEVGVGHRLEVAALRRAAQHLDTVTGYVAMNVSPASLLTAQCRALLRSLPLDRVVLELSEHDRVEDYDALTRALRPLRLAGARLAVDDVGAGFASLRHIVLTAPDVIKLDRSVVDGVAHDPVLSTLVRALTGFAHDNGATVVAEGVETAQDAGALLGLGVDHGQGWHFGRPGEPADLPDQVLPDWVGGDGSVPRPRRAS